MIRVVHVASGDLWAGAEAQVHQLLSALRTRDDLQVSAVILNPGELADRLRLAAVPVTVLDERSTGPLGLMQGILRAVKASAADVVHTHRFKENILGALAARLSGRCISVRTVHGRPEHTQNPSSKHRLLRKVDVLSSRLQAGVIGVSDELCGVLRGEYPPQKVFCIPNGVDREGLIRSAAQPTSATHHVQGKVNVALIGRLVPVKRADLFLETAARLKASDPGRFHFVIIGDGPLRGELTARSQQLGLTDEVDFLGFQSNSLSILRQMDCLALTSDHEGLPMVLLEALALGVPVVAHAVGGLSEVLANVPGQKLVTDHSPEGYAAALRELVVTDPVTRPSLLPARFEISGTAAQYAALYRKLAG